MHQEDFIDISSQLDFKLKEYHSNVRLRKINDL